MNCGDNCNCNAKCNILGKLEQKIMDVLWSENLPLKPADIIKSLSGRHAYTTITTVLKRMTDKQIIKRQLRSNVFYYQPLIAKKDYACQCLDNLFVRLFESYGAEVITSFKKIAKQQKYSF